MYEYNVTSLVWERVPDVAIPSINYPFSSLFGFRTDYQDDYLLIASVDENGESVQGNLFSKINIDSYPWNL